MFFFLMTEFSKFISHLCLTRAKGNQDWEPVHFVIGVRTKKNRLIAISKQEENSTSPSPTPALRSLPASSVPPSKTHLV